MSTGIVHASRIKIILYLTDRALKTHYENTENSKDHQEKEVVLSDEEMKPQQGKCCGR